MGMQRRMGAATRRVAWIAMLAFGGASHAGHAMDDPDAAFVLPGTFAEQTTVADLEARFGKDNVQVVEPQGGDAGRSVVLFPRDPSRRAYVEFHDPAQLSGVRSIHVRDAGSRWRGKQGVHVGMSFAALRAANGKPFGFQGFDAEGNGYATNQWSPALDGDGGSLGRLDVEEGEQMYFDVELGLRDGGKARQPGDFPQDTYVDSDDPNYPGLGEGVVVTGFGARTSLDDEW